MGKQGVLLMRKLLVITDMDSVGSGYKNICVPLFTELSTMDYETKIVGLMYRGEEHNYPFSIVPATNFEEAQAIAGNLIQLWQPDVVIVALDLPIQHKMYEMLAPHKKPYIAITPLENGPLCVSWAIPLFNMDGVFFISQLGADEAHKAGVSKAEHLQIGVDTVSWRPSFPEEKKKLREGMGIPEDAFVVLTVADNQERKNLWAGMKAISLLKKEISEPEEVKEGDTPRATRPIRYVLVTREQSPFGWKLRDLATVLGINQEYFPFERGMSQKELWALYAMSDVYLQPSKAEGLGMPVLDAMACKIPVVATDTGAMHELLTDSRGHLVEPEYTFTDVWGNSSRAMISIKDTMNYLGAISLRGMPNEIVENAYEYVTKRTWDIPAKQMDKKITEILNEQKTKTQ